jgi:site-specific DNA-methyltransferase (adenine-specific)
MEYKNYIQKTDFGKIKLYQADCMEMLPQVPDKYYDLCICDPPYGIGISRAKEVGYKGLNIFTPKEWDISTPSNEYFNELFRVSKNQIVFGGNYFNLPPTRCYLIWDKGEGFKGRSYAEAELAWTSFNANVRIFKRDPLARGDYHGKIHPTQKPVALYQWLLKNYAKPGYKILDTHGGSCPIAIACDIMGFDADIWEIDADYYRAAVERFERHKQQTVLEFSI